MRFSKHWKNGPPIFQSLENPRLVWFAVLVMAASAISARAQCSLLDDRETADLTNALACLDMTLVDLGFGKDWGKPEIVLSENRRLLAEPLLLPEHGAACLRAVTNGAAAVWEWVSRMLDAPWGQAAAGKEPSAGALGEKALGPHEADDLDPALIAALENVLRGAELARRMLDRAVENLSREEREYASASLLADFFRLEDFPDRIADIADLGVASQALARALAGADDLDPEPEAKAFLESARKVDLARLLEAGRLFYEVTRELAEAASKVETWPNRIVRLRTPLGALIVGTSGRDAYEESALLILDPGGDDVYERGAGTASLLSGAPLAAIVDLHGNDRYSGGKCAGAGTAIFGAAVVLDAAGDDVYESAGLGQGAALFGAAWLEDRAGNDTYRAGVCAQGAASCGLGVLWDMGGEDRYDVGLCGQGYAGVLGVGLLADAEGNDLYFAGGREPDFERNDDRYLSLAQGFAIGLRPFAGGGVGALVDLKGNDVYVADVYGQGVSYWYSLGMLLDAEGNDQYSVYQYGQGTGIHLSSGLLADLAGNDRYSGAILVQGSAHDYAVGMLLEKGGNDIYVGQQHAQGRALNNALAVLVDSEGDDAYFADRCEECQGIGNDGDKREYGSLALLLDLDGKDSYSCGAADGVRLERPDFGIIYDAAATERVKP
jgi:hypothetical protein